jgi:hypothetical protein
MIEKIVTFDDWWKGSPYRMGYLIGSGGKAPDHHIEIAMRAAWNAAIETDGAISSEQYDKMCKQKALVIDVEQTKN